jgi:hypothetical protein
VRSVCRHKVDRPQSALNLVSVILTKHGNQSHDKDRQNAQTVGGRWQCEILTLRATRRDKGHENYW